MTDLREIIRPFRFALDPTGEQAQQIASHCGAERFAYNHMLAAVRANLGQREAERSYGVDEENLTPSLGWSAYSLRKDWNARKDQAAPWWREVSKEAFASGCANLATALANWSSSKKGARKGARVGFPGFHGRAHRRSVTFTTGTMRVEPDRHHVTLPRLGTIHTLESTRSLSRLIEQGRARITRATVSWFRGRWVVTLLARVLRAQPSHPHPGSVVGIDVGVKDWLVAATPDGTEVMRLPVPERFQHLDRRKRALQRRHRHKQAPDRRVGRAGSARWSRAQRQIARLDHQIANLRDDLLHKATASLTRSYETVAVESLSVRGMATRGGAYKRGLNRAIHQAALARVRSDVTYKAVREGGQIVMADRFYPSSKTCSGCGSVKAKLTLSERTFICETCGVVLDRDLNAAVNLARLGASAAGSAPVDGRGAKRKTPAPSGARAAGDEASTPTVGSPRS